MELTIVALNLIVLFGITLGLGAFIVNVLEFRVIPKWREWLTYRLLRAERALEERKSQYLR